MKEKLIKYIDERADRIIRLTPSPHYYPEARAKREAVITELSRLKRKIKRGDFN